jgi:hypothetical protein
MEKPHSGNNSPDGVVVQTYIKPQTRKAHDADVKFEEYHYYAQRTREEEKAFEPPKVTWREILLRKKSRPDATWEEPTCRLPNSGSIEVLRRGYLAIYIGCGTPV